MFGDWPRADAQPKANAHIIAARKIKVRVTVAFISQVWLMTPISPYRSSLRRSDDYLPDIDGEYNGREEISF